MSSIEDLSSDEIRSLEAQVRAQRSEVKPIYQHYGPVEDMSNEDIKTLEAQIREQRSEVKPVYQHYGPVEDMSNEDIRILEAQIREQRSEVEPAYQHYGSVENLSDSDVKILEAQVSEKREQDLSFKEYFNSLISNPNISDNKQFEDAVIRSMQSNGLMKDFTSGLVQEISRMAWEFQNIEKSDIAKIQSQKQRIEKLVNVYIRYLYQLKNHGWTFYGPGNDIGLEMITGSVLDSLWKVQKNYDLVFNMPIPRDLGEYYGGAFERLGKMIPGTTLMYDDLKDKEVNWHQVIIYKENELTPRQRYMQRREEAVKQFDSARKEEIANTLANVHTQASQLKNPGMETSSMKF